MKMNVSVQIGSLFDQATVAAYGKGLEMQQKSIANARQASLLLCINDTDIRIVECRAIEAQLRSAMLNGQKDEVERLRVILLSSAFFSSKRRKEMNEVVSGFLSRN